MCYNQIVMRYIISLLAQFLAVMIVITFHEFAHAFIAYRCGDATAKEEGRMTLNPIKHFDPIGIVMFALVGFGWAKPVPVNPYRFRNYRKGSFWTSAAGIITNYAMAFSVYPIFLLVVHFICPGLNFQSYFEFFLYRFLQCIVIYSLSFCVFNLLPFYPLDGFRMIDALDKKQGKVVTFLRVYGNYVLIGLIVLSFLAEHITFLRVVDVLGYVLTFAVDIFGKPITAFWLWIFGYIF